MDYTVLIAVTIGILVLLAAVLQSHFGTKRRLKEVRALADQLGYEFGPDMGQLDSALRGSALTEQGYLSKTTPLLHTREDDAAMTIFDFDYWEGVGRNRRLRRQTALLVQCERLDLPGFVLRPEKLAQKLQTALGQQDIDFDNQSGFSSAYLLKGPDEPRIRTLFDSEKQAFFAERRGLCVDGGGHNLLVFRANKRVSPKGMQSLMADGLTMARALAGEPTAPVTD